MRRYLAALVALAFMLFALGVMAQTSTSSEPQRSTTTTTTTTTQQSTVSGTEQAVEGCLAKEGSDFFLIPAHGSPIALQASSGQDLSAHAGHKVKLHGTESSLSPSSNAGMSGTGGTAGAASSTTTTTTSSGAQSSTRSGISEPAGASGSSQAGAMSGTGNDLHRLATREMTVSKLDHIASTCPLNWNPNVRSKGSSKY